jgi:hypothetical protein
MATPFDRFYRCKYLSDLRGLVGVGDMLVTLNVAWWASVFTAPRRREADVVFKLEAV